MSDRLTTLSSLTDAKPHQILVEHYETFSEYVRENYIHQLFEALLERQAIYWQSPTTNYFHVSTV